MERRLLFAVLFAGLSFGPISVSSADIIVRNVGLHADHNSAISTSEGTVGSTTPETVNNLAVYTNAITLDGLDLDGIGGANDTVSFTINASGTASDDSDLNNDSDLDSGGLGVDGGGDGGISSPGEAITFSVSGIAVTNDDPNVSVVFDGFVGLLMSTDADGINYLVNGDVFNVVDLGFDANPVVGDMTVAYSRSGSFRVRQVDVQFTVVSAVPEPNSASLAGLAVLGLLARRRRK